MDKRKKLRGILKKLGSVVVAFSGGVDSSFLLKAASDALPWEDVLAVTAVSDTYTRSELKQAKDFARNLGVRHKVIHTDELRNPNFTKNTTKRCYYCKRELFGKLREIARKNKIDFVLDASNIDDEKDYRPGSVAKRMLKVRSPLQESCMTKKDIREYSRKMNLKTWDMPSMACLASRIPYGKKIDKATLKKIGQAESCLKNLGIKQARVRYHGAIARIETERKDIKKFLNKRFCDRIIKHLKALGFLYVVLDLEGYRTGSLNEVLK